MALAMQSGIPVREWCAPMADDPRVLDTAFELTVEAARKARGRRA